MVHALNETAQRLGHRPALWTHRDGTYQPTSWKQYADRVRHFALGLHGLGFQRGDVLAVLAFNREEWVVAELAAMALGGTAVGIYVTSSPEQVQYVLAHCSARFALVEHAAHADTVRSVRDRLPALLHLLVMEPSAAAPDARAYEEVLEAGRGADDRPYWDALEAAQPEALAALIYTSGTTGNPKGVMLSHRNLVWTTTKLFSSAPFSKDGEILLSYLPLSHVAEQVATIHGPILWGFQVYFARSLEKLPEDLRAARPTVFFGVPRVWEKFKARAEERIRNLPGRQGAVLERARRVALERHRVALSGERVPLRVELPYRAAQKLVFEPLKARLGLDRAWICVTSAAPIGVDVLEFFASVDLVLREVYGQSEVTGPATVSTEEHTRFGALGRPMIGVEVRIAEDGEILVRGENVCLGYYRDRAGTAELVRDGWLHTGDVGELDHDGYLRITGRKKELIVTSGGKKTAPAALEQRLKAIAPLGNAVVVGERRNYLAALLPLDPARVPSFAATHGFPSAPELLAKDPGFLEYLRAQVESQLNAHVARFEHVRRFRVLPHDFTEASGELTPTLKLRRKVVEAKYADVIDALYAEGEAERTG
jgi:long-chain acyl-CoA synthetase